jgi:hypothetical protein
MAGNPIVRAVADFVSVLDELGIRYYAGGSVASSIHGVPRYTKDVDLVADLAPEQTDSLVTKLNKDFYADAGQMRDALRFGRSFNAIHFATGFKIDVFPLRKDAFHEGEMARSEKRVWEVDSTDSVELKVASAEDTILEKLIWYQRGGQVSDQQWSDVLGVATTRQLDRDYLREWAPRLGVADLLDRLSGEAGQIDLGRLYRW